MTEQTAQYAWPALVDDLNALLRLKTTIHRDEALRDATEMEAIPKIRRPKPMHTTDQIVAQAARLGWTVGITSADLVGAQCSAVIGLAPQDDEWLSGKRMAGVWYEDAGGREPPPDAHGLRAVRTLPCDGGVAADLAAASIRRTSA